MVWGDKFDRAHGTLSACYELRAMAAQLTIAHGVKSTMQADVTKVNRRPAKGKLISPCAAVTVVTWRVLLSAALQRP